MIPAATRSVQAAELCDIAVDTLDFNEKLRLLQEAIRIDPLCLNAWSYWGYCHTVGPPHVLDYTVALSLCERAISCGTHRDNGSNLDWEDINDRNYMGAIFNKILVLQKMSRFREESVERLHLLRLRPQDELEVRHRLITYLICDDEFDRVREIMTEFSSSFRHSTCDLYSSLLMRFVNYSNGEAIVEDVRACLITALETNPYVPGFLTNDTYIEDFPVSEVAPVGKTTDMVTLAHAYAGFYGGWEAWGFVPGAVDWLMTQMYPTGSSTPSKDDLMTLLEYGPVLLFLQSEDSVERMLLCSRSSDSIDVSEGTEHPDDSVDDVIRVFDLSEGCQVKRCWQDILFSSITAVPFWHVLLENVLEMKANQHLCRTCSTVVKKMNKKPKLHCSECRLIRYTRHMCQVCLAASSNHHKCSSCLSVLYCSKSCQRVDWKRGHKSVCGLPDKDQGAGSLVAMLTGPHGLLVMQFLCGAGGPGSARRVLDVLALSRLNKAVRRRLRKASLWSHLVLRVDQTAADSSTQSRGKGKGGGDASFKPLLRRPGAVLCAFARFGGCDITAVALQLRNLDDKCLNALVDYCPRLSRLEILFTGDARSACKFASPAGLVSFFQRVSPLSALQLCSPRKEGVQIARFVPKEVLSVINCRRFPLTAVSLEASPSTVDLLWEVLSSSTADGSGLQSLQLFFGSDGNDRQRIDESYGLDALTGTLTFQRYTFRNVVRLDVSGHSALTDTHVGHIARCLPTLQSLNIAGRGNGDGNVTGESVLTDVCLLVLSQHCLCLRCLVISHRPSLTLAGLIPLCAANPQLELLGCVETDISSRKKFVVNILEIAGWCSQLVMIRCGNADMRSMSVEAMSEFLYPIMQKYDQILIVTPHHGLVPYPRKHVTTAIETNREKSMKLCSNAGKKNYPDICSFAHDDHDFLQYNKL